MEAGHEQFYVKVYEKTPHTSIAPGYIAYGPDDVWVQFNLMKPYRVDEIRIWNYKQNVGYGLSQRGMKNVRIEYTVQSTLIGIHSKYQSCAKHMIGNLPLLVKLLKLRVNSCA